MVRMFPFSAWCMEDAISKPCSESDRSPRRVSIRLELAISAHHLGAGLTLRPCLEGSPFSSSSRRIRIPQPHPFHELLAKLSEVVGIKQIGLILFGEGPQRS